MTTSIQVDTKHEAHRKQCFLCGKTRIYPLHMKESLAYIPTVLWREYEGTAMCVECFASITEA